MPHLSLDDPFDSLELPDEAPDITSTEDVFDKFWKPIILNPDGTLNLEQIKKELHDFYTMLKNVPVVYDHVTGGRISKPLTPAEVVCSEADAVKRGKDDKPNG